MLPIHMQVLAGLTGVAFLLHFISVFFLNWMSVDALDNNSNKVSVGGGLVPFPSGAPFWFILIAIFMYLAFAVFILLVLATAYSAWTVHQNSSIRAEDRTLFMGIGGAAGVVTLIQIICFGLFLTMNSGKIGSDITLSGGHVGAGAIVGLGFGIYVIIFDTILTLGAAGIAAYIAFLECK